MRSLLAVAALLAVTSSGCYLGNTRSDKHRSVTLDAIMVAAGAGAIGLAAQSHGNENDGCHDSCVGYPDVGSIGLALVGVGLIASGSIGLIANAATDTVPDPVAEIRVRPVTAKVTAPGLEPAAVTLDSKSVVSR